MSGPSTFPVATGDGYGGLGLTLRVAPRRSGGCSKTWAQANSTNGRKTSLGLGSYPVVTLAMARDRVANARAIAEGRGPGRAACSGRRPWRRRMRSWSRSTRRTGSATAASARAPTNELVIDPYNVNTETSASSKSGEGVGSLETRHSTFVNSLGNLTLVDKRIRSLAGNDGLAEKLDVLECELPHY